MTKADIAEKIQEKSSPRESTCKGGIYAEAFAYMKKLFDVFKACNPS